MELVQTKNRLFDRKAGLLDQVEYRLAETAQEKDEIYRLRYLAYINEGAIERRTDQRLTDRFDDLPNSWLFGVYLDGRLRSSLRVSVATPDNEDTPAVNAFPDLLGPELTKGKVIVDPNRFVADPLCAKKMPELPYLTLRLAYVACEHFHADLGTATVRAEHQAFYRRVFMHHVACPPRPYPTLTKPLSLMVVDFQTKRSKVFERYPLFRSTAEERRRLFGRQNHRLSPVITPSDFPFERASVGLQP